MKIMKIEEQWPAKPQMNPEGNQKPERKSPQKTRKDSRQISGLWGWTSSDDQARWKGNQTPKECGNMEQRAVTLMDRHQ